MKLTAYHLVEIFANLCVAILLIASVVASA